MIASVILMPILTMFGRGLTVGLRKFCCACLWLLGTSHQFLAAIYGASSWQGIWLVCVGIKLFNAHSSMILKQLCHEPELRDRHQRQIQTRSSRLPAVGRPESGGFPSRLPASAAPLPCRSASAGVGFGCVADGRNVLRRAKLLHPKLGERVYLAQGCTEYLPLRNKGDRGRAARVT